MGARFATGARALHLLVTVTFNPNQLRAHLEPILDLDEVAQVTLVADVPGPTMPKLRTVTPPRWLVRLTGRAGAKVLTGVVLSLRERPQWVLGYKLVPHGLNAVAIARLTRRRSLIHLVGGPAEWEGGGYRSDNAVLDRLPRPVPALERLLVALIGRADVVAVMGSQARSELIQRGLDPSRVVVVPASVDRDRFRPDSVGERRYDIVTTAQFLPRKRIEDLLLAVMLLRLQRPQLRAAIAGTGPLDAALRAQARRLGVEHAVDFLGFVPDIERVYAASRVFVLTSRREGLSIALVEAMACGLPAVVTDVGEARDVLIPGVNGFLIEVGDVTALVEHVDRILGDDELRRRVSAAATTAAHEISDRRRIADINRQIFVVDAARWQPATRAPRRRISRRSAWRSYRRPRARSIRTMTPHPREPRGTERRMGSRDVVDDFGEERRAP
jgi:L-malate glycosyltransferase